MAKSLREVEEQMSSVGIDVPPGVDLVVNGSNWKRFKPANSHFKRGKEAYYGIWEKSLGSGRNYYFGVFGIGSQSYKITHTRSGWTQEEWREIKARTETDQKIVDEALQDRRRSASQKAVKMLQAASSSVSMSHPYVAKKQILPYGAYQLRNQILLPMWKDGRVVGLQTVFPAETQDGSTEIQKRFLSGSDLKGSCLKLGESAQPPEAIILTEGWATACSIMQASGAPMVVVAFSAGNLLPVAESLRSEYPNTKIVIAADNDCHYHTALKREISDRFGIELNIAASKASAREQIVPGGKVMAWWTTKDKETYLEYEEWSDGRSRPMHRSLCNTGVVKAKIAASKVGAAVVIPRFADVSLGGTDFNDLAVQEGRDAVSQQLAWRQAELLSKGSGDKKVNEKNLGVISSLGKRYIAIDSTDTCWDTEYLRVTKISTIRQWFGAKTVNLWLQNEFDNRRIIQPEQLIFEPDPKKIPLGSITMFAGWPMKPNYTHKCQRLIDHLFKICGENDDLFQWVAAWLAFPLQHPGAKMQTALVVYGEREGTGKSMFFNAISKIYGQYACSVNQNMVQSDFNGWVSKKLFVVCEEVVTNQEKRNLKGALKNLVTNPTHTINEKGLPARFEANKTNFVFLSNELQPLMFDSADRRYQAIKFETASPPEYFEALADEIDNGGIESFYAYLLNFDTSWFNESKRPLETQARLDLKRLGSDSAIRFIEDWTSGNINLPVGPAVLGHLYDAYTIWCKSSGERPCSKEVFGGRCKSRLNGGRLRVQLYSEESSSTETLRPLKMYQRQVYWPKSTEDPEVNAEFSQRARAFQIDVETAKERFYRDFKSLQ